MKNNLKDILLFKLFFLLLFALFIQLVDAQTRIQDESRRQVILMIDRSGSMMADNIEPLENTMTGELRRAVSRIYRPNQDDLSIYFFGIDQHESLSRNFVTPYLYSLDISSTSDFRSLYNRYYSLDKTNYTALSVARIFGLYLGRNADDLYDEAYVIVFSDGESNGPIHHELQELSPVITIPDNLMKLLNQLDRWYNDTPREEIKPITVSRTANRLYKIATYQFTPRYQERSELIGELPTLLRLKRTADEYEENLHPVIKEPKKPPYSFYQFGGGWYELIDKASGKVIQKESLGNPPRIQLSLPREYKTRNLALRAFYDFHFNEPYYGRQKIRLNSAEVQLEFEPDLKYFWGGTVSDGMMRRHSNQNQEWIQRRYSRIVMGIVVFIVVALFVAIVAYLRWPRKASLNLNIESQINPEGPINADFSLINLEATSETEPEFYLGDLRISADYPNGRPHRPFLINRVSISPKLPVGLELKNSSLLRLHDWNIKQAKDTLRIPILLNLNSIKDYKQSGTPVETDLDISIVVNANFARAKESQLTAKSTFRMQLIPQRISSELIATAFRLE